ncbi:MAG: hypothetical protein UR53_C0001G0121 [Candidatus Magasanikbacteria bacterium GW2011_GWC2_34_16]|uniref:Uncharacterized protein n=1 Tax=Candidatus Magasanikbacteria bacterium GW2011_GWC2_34_16 TaxID=1619045 RepID=A0A0G0B7E3_9BACT|nr:MAG: hypothetical protein UR53_C0001G0121 [Candidatus Magasanikbacteria bacterium GW2011_GWC2_34_16]
MATTRFYHGNEEDRVLAFVRMFPTGAILVNLVTEKARELLGFSSLEEVLHWVLWRLCATGLAEWDKEHKVYQMKKEVLTNHRMVREVALMGSTFRRAIIAIHDSQTDHYDSSPEWEERFGFDKKDSGMMASFLRCLLGHNILVVENGVDRKIDHDALHNLAHACLVQEVWERALREEGVSSEPPGTPISATQQYAASSEAIARILKGIPEGDRLAVCANAVALLQPLATKSS